MEANKSKNNLRFWVKDFGLTAEKLPERSASASTAIILGSVSCRV